MHPGSSNMRGTSALAMGFSPSQRPGHWVTTNLNIFSVVAFFWLFRIVFFPFFFIYFPFFLGVKRNLFLISRSNHRLPFPATPSTCLLSILFEKKNSIRNCKTFANCLNLFEFILNSPSRFYGHFSIRFWWRNF